MSDMLVSVGIDFKEAEQSLARFAQKLGSMQAQLSSEKGVATPALTKQYSVESGVSRVAALSTSGDSKELRRGLDSLARSLAADTAFSASAKRSGGDTRTLSEMMGTNAYQNAFKGLVNDIAAMGGNVELVNSLASQFRSSLKKAIDQVRPAVQAVQPGQTDFSALNRVVGTVVAPEPGTRAIHTTHRKAPVLADSQSDAESSAATKENVKATKRNTRAKEQSAKAEEENAASLKKSTSVNERIIQASEGPERPDSGYTKTVVQNTATDRTSGSAVVDDASKKAKSEHSRAIKDDTTALRESTVETRRNATSSKENTQATQADSTAKRVSADDRARSDAFIDAASRYDDGGSGGSGGGSSSGGGGWFDGGPDEGMTPKDQYKAHTESLRSAFEVLSEYTTETEAGTLGHIRAHVKFLLRRKQVEHDLYVLRAQGQEKEYEALLADEAALKMRLGREQLRGSNAARTAEPSDERESHNTEVNRKRLLDLQDSVAQKEIALIGGTYTTLLAENNALERRIRLEAERLQLAGKDAEQIELLAAEVTLRRSRLAEDAKNIALSEQLSDPRGEAEYIGTKTDSELLSRRVQRGVRRGVATDPGAVVGAAEDRSIGRITQGNVLSARMGESDADKQSQAVLTAYRQLLDLLDANAARRILLIDQDYILGLKERSLIDGAMKNAKDALILADSRFTDVANEAEVNRLRRERLSAGARVSAVDSATAEELGESADITALSRSQRLEADNLALEKQVSDKRYLLAQERNRVLRAQLRLASLSSEFFAAEKSSLTEAFAQLNAVRQLTDGRTKSGARLDARRGRTDEDRDLDAELSAGHGKEDVEDANLVKEKKLQDKRHLDAISRGKLLDKQLQLALSTSEYLDVENALADEELALVRARKRIAASAMGDDALHSLFEEDRDAYGVSTGDTTNNKRERASATKRHQMLGERGRGLTLEAKTLDLKISNNTLEDRLNSTAFQQEERRRLVLSARQKMQDRENRRLAALELKAEGFAEPDKGFWGGEVHGRVGSVKGALQNPGEFFGGGLLSTMKYGVGAGIMYGSWGLIKDAVKDSEDLAISFTKLEAQLADIGHLDAFEGLKKSIVDTSRATGVAADEVAATALRMEGAFGRTTAANALRGGGGRNLYGVDLVKEQSEAAAKLMMVTDLTQKEASDGLVAASLAFGASGQVIGDVAVRLETATGTSSGELIGFLGDIGPAAREAGFSLEEFAAIGATVLKQSGMGGSALAEQMGRIIAALSTNTSSFFEMANANMAAFGDDYDQLIKAIQNNEVDKVFMTLAKNFNNLSKGAKTYIVDLLGGQRQANALLAAFGDPEGIKSANDAAEDASGALDKRVERLQKRISVIFARIRTEFNTMVKAIIDAGVGDAVIELAETLGGAVKIFAKVFEFVTGINDALGGWLTKITSIVAQVMLLKAAITAISVMNKKRNDLRISGLELRGRTYYPLGGGPGGAPGYFRNIGDSYKAARQGALDRSLAAQAGPAGGVNPARQLGALTRAGAGARGAGAAFLTAVGGWGGAGFLAAGGVLAAYQTIKGKIEADKAQVRSVIAEATDSDKSAEDLRREAETWRRKHGDGWSQKIFGTENEADALDYSALYKEEEEWLNSLGAALDEANTQQLADLDALFDGTVIDKGMRSTIVDAGLPDSTTGQWPFVKLYEDKTKSFGEALADNMIEVGLIGQELYDVMYNKIEKSMPDGTPEDLIHEMALAGTGYAELYDAIDPSNAIQSLHDLIDKDSGASARSRTAAIKLLELVNTKAMNDKDLLELFQLANRATTSYELFMEASLETMIANLDAAGEWYDSGRISTDEYVAALERVLEQSKGQKDITAEGYAAILKLENQIAEVTTENLKKKAERANRLTELTAGDENGTELRTIEMNVNLLNAEGFDSATAREDAAFAILDSQRALVDRLVSEAKSLEEVDKLINEGVAIPIEARAALFRGDLAAKDAYIETKRLFDQSKAYNVKDPLTSDVFKDIYKDTIASLPSSEDLIKQVEGDILSAGEVTSGTMATLGGFEDSLRAALARGKVEGITSAEEATIDGALNFILGLMGKAYETKRLLAEKARLTDMKENAPDPFGWLGRIADKGLADVEASLGALESDPTSVAFGATSPERIFADAKKMKEEQEKKREDERSAELALMKARAEARGDIIEAARLDVEAAQAALDFADSNGASPAELNKLRASLVTARAGLRSANNQMRQARFDYVKIIADDNGDIVASAQTGVAAAQAALDEARSAGVVGPELLQLQGALVQARSAVRDAINSQRESQVALLRTVITGDDPLRQAEFDLNMAKTMESEARGVKAKADAAKARIEAERGVAAQMADLRLAMMDLRMAQLQAMDDEVGAAMLSQQQAQQQLADAIARDAGPAEVARLQAAIVSADKSARDTITQDKLDEYQYLLDTGKITKTQYIEYLQALQSTLSPASKQFKDLERTLYQLKNEIGSDLQMNLPTDLSLPTLYEARRLSQSTQYTGSGAPESIGYQDNRNMDVQIVINKDMDEGQILSLLSDALGTGRNALTVTKRY